VGVPDRSNNLEAVQLKLSAKQFPLPCTLRELVLKRYNDAGAATSGGPTLAMEELLGYLAAADDPGLTPMESVLRQTESIGEPALPAAEQAAKLNWLGAAFNLWEIEFPLDETLTIELRRLKPLAAAQALTNPDFLIPGKHPLHQLLDNLQLAAVGWQARLGRAGQATRKQLTDAVNAVLALPPSGYEDELAALCSTVIAATERDKARASRMAQRMIETEQGKIKTAEAKRQAAQMINEVLLKFPAPPTIGRFLKGPWYESAQLVLLKFGPDSEQWEHVCATTEALLDSLQLETAKDPARRQRAFETIPQLPKDLKRWLLSLQHDSEAVSDAIGVIEFAHLRILRQQPLELEKIPLLDVEAAAQDTASENELDALRAGQWFSVDTGEADPVRVQLVLRMDNERQLLFANQAGIKVLQHSFEEFAALQREGKVSLLDSGASFSRSLTSAAGINSNQELETLLGATAQQVQRAEEAREQRAKLQQARDEAERQQAEANTAQDDEQARLQREWDEAEQAKRDRESAERSPQDSDSSREKAERLRRAQAEARREQLEQQEKRRRLHDQGIDSSVPPPPQSPEPAEQTGEAPTAGADEQIEINLPMGTWLGFHDGETPLMAKLAVYDLEQNNYIFVNRNGIKMRELSKEELLALLEQGMVDVLETKSHFKDEVTRVKQRTED
jgi:hypothetical protein